MGTPEGRQHMLARHEIVVRIIETNSNALRLDNEINGLDIERRVAERDLGSTADAGQPQQVLAQVTAKLEALRERRSKLEAERQWLEQALSEFDGTPAHDDTNSGRA
jgi:hypothetical protein